MIDPPFVKSGNAFCTVKSTPLTLTSNRLSKWSSVIDPSGANAKKPGVREQDVEASLLPLYGGEQPVEVREVRDVAWHSSDVLADLLHRLIEFRLAAAGDEDISPFVYELSCRGQANATVAAGNEGNFSFKLTFGS
jgi:hypothetical protein